MKYRIFFITSLFYFSACQCGKEVSFSQKETQRSWEESRELLLENVMPNDWAAHPVQEFDHYGIIEVESEQTGIYKKIIEYEPISLSLFTWIRLNRSFKIHIFNFQNTLDAFGAYSRLRKPGLPSYAHRLLTPPSEAFYLPERLVVFRSHFLWIIEHALEDLALLKKVLNFMSSQVPNDELKHIPLDTLPVSNRVIGSEYYKKKNFLGLEHLRNCASAKYDPQESISIFICESGNKKEAKKGLLSHRDHVEYGLALGKPLVKTKEFSRQDRTLRVKYFFYTSGNYELYSFFTYDQYIFGITGSSSEAYTFAIANQIMEQLAFRPSLNGF